MKKISLALVAALGLAASFANAANVTGKITAVQTAGHTNPGWISFKVEPIAGGGTPASCVTTTTVNYTFFDGDNGSTIENPHVQNLVLAAYNGNKTVIVNGLGVCYNGREMLGAILIQ